MQAAREQKRVEGDIDWNTKVTVRLKPDPRLTPAKRKIVADYGMERDALRITTRGPLLQYALNQLQLDPKYWPETQRSADCDW